MQKDDILRNDPGILGGIRQLSGLKLAKCVPKDNLGTFRIRLLFSTLVAMLALYSASAEMCDLLNPNACGLCDCGGNSWSPDETQGYGDNLSLRSGQVDMIGASRVCMKVAGPGLIKFVWKADSLAQHVGSLGFLVDNVPVAVCKSPLWTPVSYTLREKRDYDLVWQFYKFKSIPAGLGGGWIDDLNVIKGTVGKSPPILPEIFNEYNLDNQSSTSCPPPEKSGCNCREIRSDLPASGNETCSGALGLSAVSSPNISINIALIPTTNVSINISGISGPVSNINQDRNLAPGMASNITPYINKSKNVFVSQNKCEEPDCYDNIGEAIGAVDNGGNVTINEGIYNESVLINKSLRLIGRNNTTVKIVVRDQDGITVSCGEGTVSLENLTIINEFGSCKKTIGINDTTKSHDTSIRIEDCSILNFTIGAKVGKSKLIFARNKIISSTEFEDIVDGCQLCTYANNSARGKHYLVGLWFNAPLGAFEIHNNSIELRNDTNRNLYTYGIVHEGPTSECAYTLLSTQECEIINTTACKIMYLRGRDSADCAR